MTSVSDYVSCKQCGYLKAYYDFNCDTSEEEVSCGRCGYYAAAERHEEGGQVTWTHVVKRGWGVVFYHAIDSPPTAIIRFIPRKRWRMPRNGFGRTWRMARSRKKRRT